MPDPKARTAKTHPIFDGRPHLVAHRGGSQLAPENTVAAFHNAVSRFAPDMIELDVRATADGHCVVIHDATVDRTTDGTGTIAEMTLAELRELDAGYRFTPDGGQTYPFRARGVVISTIDETLATFPQMRFIVEVKEGRAQTPLFEAISKLDAAQRVIVGGMHDRDRDQFAAYPGPISASGDDLRRFMLRHKLGLKATMPADAVHVPERHGFVRIMTPRFVRAMHAQDIPVYVWTVNDEADMTRLFDWGVDGILSDRPDLLRRVMDARAIARAERPRRAHDH